MLGSGMGKTKSEIECGAEKPKALPVNQDGIPDDLKALPQWVCWRYQQRPDKKGSLKWTKPPINPRTGQLAKSTDASTWGTFAEAFDHYQNQQLDGIGFVFSAR